MNAAFDVDHTAILHKALVAVVPELHRSCRDSWVLIGSAAAQLAGAKVVVADLDVLTSRRDAEILIGQWQGRLDKAYVPADGERFRSHFGRFLFTGLPLEIMGGLELFGAHGWEPVQVGKTVTVEVAGLHVAIPVVAEQVRVLENFGRPKDLQRAALLKSLSGERM
jgi:hypothetical protein